MRAVNLIPAGQRPGASKITGDSDGAAFIVIGVIVGLAVMMLLYGKAHKQVSSRQSEAASLTARAQSAQEQANKLTPYTSFLGLQTERVNAVSQLIGTRFDWAHAFHELGRVLPTNVSLSSVQGTIAGGSTPATVSSPGGSPSSSASASVSSATPPGSTPTMSISGCTDSQSDVAVALARLRLINGVNEVSLQSSTKGGGAGGCGPDSPTFSALVTFEGLPSPAAPSTGSGKTTPAATSAPPSTPSTTTTQSTVSTPASPAPTTASTHASPAPTTASTASPHASPAPTTASTHSTSANGNS
jgi:Tfp pilus assembly protein PilN